MGYDATPAEEERWNIQAQLTGFLKNGLALEKKFIESSRFING